MMCADMKGDKIKLQNTSKRDHTLGHYWYFMIDTCDALKIYTGATDCVPDAEVREIMNEFIVTTKTTT